MSDPVRLHKTLAELQENGVVVFPSVLSDQAIQRLRAFTESTPAMVRRMDGQDGDLYVGKEIYTGGKPEAVRYDYDTSDLLNHKDIQALLADGSIITVVQEYLGCQPTADVLSMWWHTAFHDQPDSEAAQLFHFDMDRIKWLKIFIYLTDVGQENGPHSFVRGTHRTGAIPLDVLRRGYVRLSDEDVSALYSENDILSFTAPRGSIIVEDTRGFHKGVNVLGDSRLILQLQFSNSLFGTNYPKAQITQVIEPRLKLMLESFPSIYRQYR
jgi:ectoine hydroxylase-related dioxygenase (phytanoyl-CoA dioxygenase family)